MFFRSCVFKKDNFLIINQVIGSDVTNKILKGIRLRFVDKLEIYSIW